MKSYEKIIALLKTNNVPYEEIEHGSVYTSEQATKVRDLSLSQVAKSLLLKGDDNFILVVLPGDRKFDTKKLKKLLKIKNLRFAQPEEVKDKMGCEVGACYPFGVLIGLPTYVDKFLSRSDTVCCSAGLHTRSIKIKWRDFYSVIKPKIIDVSTK